MTVDALLSTIILVAFLVTIIMAIGSYLVYKLRESRRPGADEAAGDRESPFFERIEAEDVGPDRGEGAGP